MSIDDGEGYVTVEVVITEGVGDLLRGGHDEELKAMLDWNVGKAPGALIHSRSDGFLEGQALAIYESSRDGRVYVWLESEEPQKDRPPQELGLQTSFHESTPGGEG